MAETDEPVPIHLPSDSDQFLKWACGLVLGSLFLFLVMLLMEDAKATLLALLSEFLFIVGTMASNGRRGPRPVNWLAAIPMLIAMFTNFEVFVGTWLVGAGLFSALFAALRGRSWLGLRL